MGVVCGSVSETFLTFVRGIICTGKLLTGIIAILVASANVAYGDWELWISPPKRVFEPDEQFRIIYGISGMGHLKPSDVKVTVYSEQDTELRKTADAVNHNVFIMMPDVESDFREANHGFTTVVGRMYGLEIESHSPFPPLYVTPTSTGEKLLTFILTYKSEEGDWVTKRAEFSYRVPTWYQRNETWIQWVSISAGMTGIAALIFRSGAKKTKQKNTRRR